MRFDYYFFDENCSWALLGLLQVARPDARPAGRASTTAWAMPADTVRATLASIGLVGEPDLARRRRRRASRTPRVRCRPRSAVWYAISRRARARPTTRTLAALRRRRRAAVLVARLRPAPPSRDTGHTSRRSARARARCSSRARRYRCRATSCRRRRRRRRGPIADTSTSRAAHRQRRARRTRASSSCARARRSTICSIRRAASRAARRSTSSIVALRVLPRAQAKVRLHELRLLDIVSLAPRDALFRPISWRFGTALESELVRRRERARRTSGTRAAAPAPRSSLGDARSRLRRSSRRAPIVSHLVDPRGARSARARAPASSSGDAARSLARAPARRRAPLPARRSAQRHRGRTRSAPLARPRRRARAAHLAERRTSATPGSRSGSSGADYF